MSDGPLRVTADLSFTIDVPHRSARPTRCTGRVEADGGRDVTVSFSPMPSLYWLPSLGAEVWKRNFGE